jgi:UPF0042 nucleotide-binding protein
MEHPRLVVITGMSGAGKTQVMRFMEDLGYFCVDNLPPALIPKFAELCSQSGGRVQRIALVVDIRGGDFFDQLMQVLEDLEGQGVLYEVLFLEASDDTLIRRYKETRRRHPLAPEGRISEGIRQERDRLEYVRGRATHIIDTSDLTTAQLKTRIVELFEADRGKPQITINMVSFGFKYGMPLDADMMFDVRFLPNPFYVESLRTKSGENQAVAEYIDKWPVTHQFLKRLQNLIDFLVPHYIKEGKSQLVIAVGCTGGLHRSVFVVRKIAESLKKQGYRVAIEHRDVKHNVVEAN